MSLRRSLVNPLLARAGYRIERHPHDQPGAEPMVDVASHFRQSGRAGSPLVVFDVGANVGTWTIDIRQQLPACIIHAFEPDDQTAQTMQQRTANLPNLTINTCGLGASAATACLHQFEHHFMNSLLPPGPASSDVKTVGETQVEVRTIDDYCGQHSINQIDVLKTDTQGFDLEVMRGAQSLFDAGRIELVLCEVIFARHYEGMARADEIMQFLFEQGLELMALYPTTHQHRRAAWTDMLFVRPSR